MTRGEAPGEAPGGAAPEAGSFPSRRISRWAWIALLAGLAIWGAALGAHPRRVVDLRIYLRAAERFWSALPLYPLSDGVMPFKYAPAAGWLFLPFAALPPRLAGALWNVAGVAGLAIAARIWQTALAEDGRIVPSNGALVFATLVLGQSFFLELFFGQVDLCMLALLSAPLSARGRRPARSGLSLALACLLKPTAGLVFVALLAKRRFRTVAFAVLWVAILHLPLLLRYGWHGMLGEWQAWVATLDRTTAPWVLGHNAQGLPTLLLGLAYPADFAPPRAVLAAAEVLGAAAFAAASLLFLRGPTAWAALCLGTALVSPLAWRANFVLAWPLIFALLSARRVRLRWLAMASVAAVSAVEWMVLESFLGIPRTHAVLATRVWGLAFVTLAGVAFVVLRQRGTDFRTSARSASEVVSR